MHYRVSSTLLVLLVFAGQFPIHAAELPQAPAGAFSIVVIPDTQHYKTSSSLTDQKGKRPLTNKVFDGFTDWIVANLDRQRIVFVSHVGDIVDKNNREQWAVARRNMDKLHGRVPYGISVGNHDMITGSGDSSLFQEVFSKSRFEAFDWYGGSFTNPSGKQSVSGNNANSFQLFTAGEMKFIALHLECNAPDKVLDWAGSVLEKHADRRALITTHMGWGPKEKPKKAPDYFDAPKGRMQWQKCHGKNGNTPQQTWEKCFSQHRNVFMVCSGDQSRTQAYRHLSKGVHGNPIHELLSDYGANGLRVMRFVPAKDQIEVRTWDPLKERLCEKTSVVKDRSQHQFTLGYEMK
ncbi:MAG: metallophosphoesterase [Verrucomicrobiia bacterium]|jgi:hypothetical protein